MSKFTAWDDILEKLNWQEKLLQSPGYALAQSVEQSLAAATLDLTKPIIDLPETIFRQYDVLDKMVASPILDQLAQMERQYAQVFDVAEKLLKAKKMPITHVAAACGFNDSNYFSTVFKKIKGITPLKYSKTTDYE